MEKEKIHLKDILESTIEHSVKIVTIGDKRYFADKINKDDFATHDDCHSCGTEFKKDFTHQRFCNECSAKEGYQKYLNLEIGEWNGKDAICTLGGDRYFFDEDELNDYCIDNETTPESLKLVLCKKTKFSPIDLDYFADDTHEDWEPSKELVEKIREFNRFLENESTDTWIPTNKRVIINSTPIK